MSIICETIEEMTKVAVGLYKEGAAATIAKLGNGNWKSTITGI